MSKQVYLTGYTGKKPADLKAVVESMDARLIDIRYSPKSRVPQWRVPALIELLGRAYHLLPALGNAAFREKRIQIADFNAGEKWLAYHFENHPDQPVILLCACKDAAVCHRTVVGDGLKEHGYEVVELSEWKVEG